MCFCCISSNQQMRWKENKLPRTGATFNFLKEQFLQKWKCHQCTMPLQTPKHKIRFLKNFQAVFCNLLSNSKSDKKFHKSPKDSNKQINTQFLLYFFHINAALVEKQKREKERNFINPKLFNFSIPDIWKKHKICVNSSQKFNLLLTKTKPNVTWYI